MISNARCWRLPLAVLAAATILLTACATGSSETTLLAVCPPVVVYSPAFQARAAEELGVLPDGSAIAEMMADYAVMRDQARACAGNLPLKPQ